MVAETVKSKLTVSDLRAIFAALSRTMEENRQLLTDLDAGIGDGDLGITMTKGFAAAAGAANSFAERDAGRLLLIVGITIAKTAPSTLGTLIASGFMKASREVTGRETLSLSDCAQMMNSFVQGIMDRGKSVPGEKTIVDALFPAAQALKLAPAETPLSMAWAGALDATFKGLEQTEGMKALHGRASYYGENSVGKQDPGAMVGMLLVKTIAEFLR